MQQISQGLLDWWCRHERTK